MSLVVPSWMVSGPTSAPGWTVMDSVALLGCVASVGCLLLMATAWVIERVRGW